MPQPAGTPEPQDAEAFVGRSRELAVLSAAWRQSAAGDSRLALVSGEPGIGKTELARAFARTAGDDGAMVLWGSAWEDGGVPPYWPWVQVLRSYARQAGARRHSPPRPARKPPYWPSYCPNSARPTTRLDWNPRGRIRPGRARGPGWPSSMPSAQSWTRHRRRRRSR